MRRLPEFVRHIWADFNGYFWIPCPICGQMFGGQEVSGSWYDEPEPGFMPGSGTGVCPNCVQEAERRNAAGEYNMRPRKPDVWSLERRLKEVERIMPRMVALDKWLGMFDDDTPSPTPPPANDAA